MSAPALRSIAAATSRRLDPRRLSLRWRLSLAMVLVLSATLLLAVGAVLRNARSAVTDELQASLTSASSSLDATLLLLDRIGPDDRHRAVFDWIAAQSASRHLCVAIRSGPIAYAADTACPEGHHAVLHAPAWFARGALQNPLFQHREVTISELPYSIMLIADPTQEINESWDETRSLLQLMVLMAFTANVVIMLLTRLALRPLDAATRALSQLRDGDFVVTMPATGVPDLQCLVRGIDQLSQRLARSADENRRLLLKNLDVQEEERRLMARELHDEIGQHVAAIEMATIPMDAQAPGVIRVRESVAEIHRLSRRMIRRLRPAALDTLGLAGGLQALLQQWRENQPAMQLVDEIDPACDRIDAYIGTHVYRIVQEALSNAMRHARADQVQIQVLVVDQELRLHIADDGHGFDLADKTAGLGLMGLRERVKAIGGRLDIATAPYAGCRIKVRLPLPNAPKSRKRDLAILAPSTLPSDVHVVGVS